MTGDQARKQAAHEGLLKAAQDACDEWDGERFMDESMDALAEAINEVVDSRSFVIEDGDRG